MVWIIGMIALGVAAGFMSGLLGIGGGILIIPALAYFFSMDQKLAQGTTLLMMLPPIGILAAWEYLRQGQADWKVALWLCAGFIIGGYLGAHLANDIPTGFLRRLFGLSLLVVGLKMLLKP